MLLGKILLICDSKMLIEEKEERDEQAEKGTMEKEWIDLLNWIECEEASYEYILFIQGNGKCGDKSTNIL